MGNLLLLYFDIEMIIDKITCPVLCRYLLYVLMIQHSFQQVDFNIFYESFGRDWITKKTSKVSHL